ncbi:MAG: cytochrome b N-terminal domain-containing protein [Candidatus Tectomicrobia bacterium]|nr:cytochrome b N-terminal domain-containing protein [Candidatus Tectomicrobia bacterium]
MRKAILTSQVWRAVFRRPLPRSPREQKQAARNNFFLHLHPATLPRQRLRLTTTFCMGGISFLLFIILTVTGLLLMFYYRPTTAFAYRDMKDLEYAVTMGQFLRNLHRWAAHGMVLTVIAHMARVVYARAYKPPREFNWVVGVSLLVLTLFLSFTGYLLPWDQLAYWATSVGTNMLRAMPVLGAAGPASLVDLNTDVGFYFLGGRVIGESSLIRFYVLHVFVLPVVAIVLMMVHFWRVRKDGMLKTPL